MMRLYSGMVASVAWSLSITSAKASFAVMFLRILQPTGGSWVRPLNISILVFLACQATEEILVVLLQCKPFAKAFDDTIDGNCYSLETMWLCDVGCFFFLFFSVVEVACLFQIASLLMICVDLVVCVQLCRRPRTLHSANPDNMVTPNSLDGQQDWHHHHAIHGAHASLLPSAGEKKKPDWAFLDEKTLMLTSSQCLCHLHRAPLCGPTYTRRHNL